MNVCRVSGQFKQTFVRHFFSVVRIPHKTKTNPANEIRIPACQFLKRTRVLIRNVLSQKNFVIHCAHLKPLGNLPTTLKTPPLEIHCIRFF